MHKDIDIHKYACTCTYTYKTYIRDRKRESTWVGFMHEPIFRSETIMTTTKRSSAPASQIMCGEAHIS